MLQVHRREFEVVPSFFGPQTWDMLENKMAITYKHWRGLTENENSSIEFSCILDISYLPSNSDTPDRPPYDKVLGVSIQKRGTEQGGFFVKEVVNNGIVRGHLLAEDTIISISDHSGTKRRSGPLSEPILLSSCPATEWRGGEWLTEQIQNLIKTGSGQVRIKYCRKYVVLCRPVDVERRRKQETGEDVCRL